MVDPSKYKEEKQRRIRREMLGEWYGKEIADTEITAHGPQIKTVQELMDDVSRRIFTEDVRRRMVLEQEWEKVAGGQLASLTRPGGFNNGVLDIEVRHAAFLRELDGTKDLLVRQVNRFLGAEVCKSIRFTASSGRKR